VFFEIIVAQVDLKLPGLSVPPAYKGESLDSRRPTVSFIISSIRSQ
jgi:hypothetical protein